MVLLGSGGKSLTMEQESLRNRQELVLDFLWMLKISTDGQVMAIIGQKRVYIYSKQSCEDS